MDATLLASVESRIHWLATRYFCEAVKGSLKFNAVKIILKHWMFIEKFNHSIIAIVWFSTILKSRDVGMELPYIYLLPLSTRTNDGILNICTSTDRKEPKSIF
jgi:hypothetical protein